MPYFATVQSRWRNRSHVVSTVSSVYVLVIGIPFPFPPLLDILKAKKTKAADFNPGNSRDIGTKNFHGEKRFSC
jgi:hypothetical protein